MKYNIITNNIKSKYIVTLLKPIKILHYIKGVVDVKHMIQNATSTKYTM